MTATAWLQVRMLLLTAMAVMMPAAALGQGSGAAAPPGHPALMEEVTFLDIRGKAGSYRLEAVITRPAAAKGHLPIALLTHGKPRFAKDMATTYAETFVPQARDLAYRGYLAVAVIRRGYGRSGGTPGKATNAPYVKCSHNDLRNYFAVESDDLEGALRVVAERPDADGKRAIAIGASVGGGAALALAARNPPGLVAAVNLAGAVRLTDAQGKLICPQETPIAALASFGSQTKTPTLWIYSENDSNFGPDVARKVHAAYVAQGGVASLRIVPPLPEDGHQVFERTQGRQHWLAALDQFLRAQSLPTWNMQQVDGVIRNFKIPANSRQRVEAFFSLYTPRVLVQWPNLGVGYTAAPNGLEPARQQALGQCQKSSAGKLCRVIMENFTVVSARK